METSVSSGEILKEFCIGNRMNNKPIINKNHYFNNNNFSIFYASLRYLK